MASARACSGTDRCGSWWWVGIVIGWGAALLPLGLTDLIGPGLAGFAVGGLIYGPFTAICTALFQRTSPPHALAACSPPAPR